MSSSLLGRSSFAASLNSFSRDAGIRSPGLKFVPLEANVGDQVLFLRKAAIEIEFAGETFLIVPHGAILVLARDEKRDSDRATEFREDDFKI